MIAPRLALITTSPLALRTFFVGQIRRFVEHGVDTHAVSAPGPLLEECQRLTGVRVHAVPMKRRVSPVSDLSALLRLVLLLWRLKPHIVHAHTPKAGLLGMLAAVLAGIKVRIYTVHGLPLMTRSGLRKRLLTATERLTCGLATEVLFVSDSLRTFAVDARLCPRGKARILGEGSCAGLDLGRFDPARAGATDRVRIRRRYLVPESATLVGFVGRIVRDKGIEELAGAWGILRDEFPKLRLLLCGDVEQDDPVPSKILDGLRKDPRVHWANETPEEMPGVYSAIDICVLPSYREGLPTVALEASAMEVPIVATRIPGCTNATEDGVTGVLVEPRNAAGLAGAVRVLIRNPDLRVRMGKAGRAFVASRFSESRVSALLLAEYRRLLNSLRPPGAGRGETVTHYLLKRAIDLAGALAGLAITSPLLAVCLAVILVTMGRPMLFRQLRPGRDGRLFTFYKLRTMTNERGPNGKLLPDAQRLTTLGMWIRRFSIDELPQLWNVLKGEMSLVGPRPLLADYLSRYNSIQRRRLEVKPGITGHAQIHGRNSISWEEKFTLDVWYVDHQGLWLDLKILFKTLALVLLGQGISRPGHATMPEFLGSPAAGCISATRDRSCANS